MANLIWCHWCGKREIVWDMIYWPLFGKRKPYCEKCWKEHWKDIKDNPKHQ